MEIRKATPSDNAILAELASCMWSATADELVDEFTLLTS